MNAPLFFRCLIALAVWQVPFYALAQMEPPPDLGYDPPAGWDYIRDLDSMDFTLYAHNDSLFSRSKSITLNSQQKFEHSFDGGKTWFVSGLPPIQDAAFTYPLHIQGTSMLYIIVSDTPRTLIVSSDMGATWEERNQMKYIVPDPTRWKINSSLFVDPHNPYKNWFIKYSESKSSGGDRSIYDNLYSTTDGGVTWRLLKIPSPQISPGATSVEFEVKFDFRDSGAWYFVSRGYYQPHLPPWDTSAQYYLSRDKGETFNQISIIGDLIGVTAKSEHLLWLEQRGSITGFTVVDTNDNVTPVNVLEKINPSKFPLSTEKNYYFTISDVHILKADPSQVLYTANEFQFDEAIDSFYFQTSWLYYTNDGASFSKMWEQSDRGRIGRISLDQATGSVYVVSLDTPRNKYFTDGGIYKRSLWKKKIFRPKSFVTELPNYFPTYINAYQADNILTIIIQLKDDLNARVTIRNLLGQEAYLVHEGLLLRGLNKFSINIRKVPAGIYFIQLENIVCKAIKKIFILH